MRWRKIIFKITVFVLAVVVTVAALWRMDRGPKYDGRPVADWVNEALHENGRTPAFETVLKIGSPAVPFIAQQGLYGRSHRFSILTTDRLILFGQQHPRLNRWLKLEDWDVCIERHLQAAFLLQLIGTNAQAAIPDVVNCLEHCPELHYIHTMELLDTLGEISGTNRAAIPYLTRCARGDDSVNLHAAYVAYKIDGQTNLFIETCERLAKTDPKSLAESSELFWLRSDRQLNQHLIPLLEKIYANPSLDAVTRESVMLALQSRTNAALSVKLSTR